MVNRISTRLLSHPECHAKINYFLINQQSPAHFKSQFNQDCLIVAVGSQALEALLANDIHSPILSVLIREHVYKDLLDRYRQPLEGSAYPIAAIYLDQPIDRQLELIKTLFENRKPPHIGILLSHNSLIDHDTIQSHSNLKQVQPSIAYVEEYDHPVKILNQLFKKVDVILAVPDPKIYHAGSVRGILITAFHHRIPIIGYSHTFVNNGALACVYSSPKQISEQVVKTILNIELQSFDSIPKEQYPQDFKIAINHQVAKSLGFQIEDENLIKDNMNKPKAKIRSLTA